MLCAPNLWTHRPVVPERTGEADEARAVSYWWGDP